MYIRFDVNSVLVTKVSANCNWTGNSLALSTGHSGLYVGLQSQDHKELYKNYFIWSGCSGSAGMTKKNQKQKMHTLYSKFLQYTVVYCSDTNSAQIKALLADQIHPNCVFLVD